ncbi:hypothetical protein SARC_04961 [Sphaeroforma arctica JP610]|uniref:Uncharacterized protein n=1 Tax=Sphaeroforma arctica JP610 TaxID=667725 RepID=A0A0L0G1Q8_9EUKA|nr:hypothetical protein SARC_04961 [Sphaeroforma arctica JP610]KNC82761.1 hypothetical protein SARC_04961 [Sphaeroforma arctica JP610]|eukprot:XP_014156663.1 hypothetical protein SARC_04961 [Sphaeroforma arctica JP610]
MSLKATLSELKEAYRPRLPASDRKRRVLAGIETALPKGQTTISAMFRENAKSEFSTRQRKRTGSIKTFTKMPKELAREDSKHATSKLSLRTEAQHDMLAKYRPSLKPEPKTTEHPCRSNEKQCCTSQNEQGTYSEEIWCDQLDTNKEFLEAETRTTNQMCKTEQPRSLASLCRRSSLLQAQTEPEPGTTLINYEQQITQYNVDTHSPNAAIPRIGHGVGRLQTE